MQRLLHDVPDGDDWLSVDERGVQAGLLVPKRRADWRLGRWTAKAALSAALGGEPSDVSILAAPDGAPEAFVDGQRLSVSLSISHRAGVGLAAVSREAVVGGDLELVEPRSPAFVREWFGEREQESIAAAHATGRHHELTCLLWSVKEASAKVLREGLRLDPRSAAVTLVSDPAADSSGGPWHTSTVEWPSEGRVVPGWWRIDGPVVCAIATDRPTGMPTQLR